MKRMPIIAEEAKEKEVLKMGETKAENEDEKAPESGESSDQLEEDLSLKADIYLKSYKARYGFLSENSSLLTYIRALFARITDNDQVKVEVTRDRGDKNAFALPNGVIVLNKALLMGLDYEEEIMALLKHELRHIEKKHALNLMKLQQNSQHDDTDAFLRYIGEKRLAEVIDADLSGLEDLDNRGVNIEGVFSLLGKLMSWSKSPHKGTFEEHGRSFERVVMAKTTLNFKDFKNYSEHLTPIPADRKKEMQEYDYRMNLKTERVDVEAKMQDRLRVLEEENLSVGEILTILTDHGCYRGNVKARLNDEEINEKMRNSDLDYLKKSDEFVIKLRERLGLSNDLIIFADYIEKWVEYFEVISAFLKKWPEEKRKRKSYIDAKIIFDEVTGRLKANLKQILDERVLERVEKMVLDQKESGDNELKIIADEGRGGLNMYLQGLDGLISNKERYDEIKGLMGEIEPKIEKVNKGLTSLLLNLGKVKPIKKRRDPISKLNRPQAQDLSKEELIKMDRLIKFVLWISGLRLITELGRVPFRQAGTNCWNVIELGGVFKGKNLIGKNFFKKNDFNQTGFDLEIDGISSLISREEGVVIANEDKTYADYFRILMKSDDKDNQEWIERLNKVLEQGLELDIVKNQECFDGGILKMKNVVDRLKNFNSLDEFIGLYFTVFLTSIEKVDFTEFNEEEYLNLLVNFWKVIKSNLLVYEKKEDAASALDGLLDQMSDVMMGRFLGLVIANKSAENINEFANKTLQLDILFNEKAFANLHYGFLMADKPKREIKDWQNFLTCYQNKLLKNVLNDRHLKNRFIEDFENEIDSFSIKELDKFIELLYLINLDIDDNLRLQEKVINSRKFDLAVYEDRLTLLKFATICVDVELGNGISKKVWNEVKSELEGGKLSLRDFIEKYYREVEVSVEIMEIITEKIAKSKDDFEVLMEIGNDLRERNDIAGKKVMFETGLDMLTRDKIKLLRALMDPKNLRIVQEGMLTALNESMDSHNYLTGHLHQRHFPKLDEVTLNIVGSSSWQKRLILHELLVGEGGVLSSEEHMKKTIEILFEFFATDDKNEKEFIDEIKKILNIAIESVNKEDMYLIFFKLLEPRFMKCRKLLSWSSFDEFDKFDEFVDGYVQDLKHLQKKRIMEYVFGKSKGGRIGKSLIDQKEIDYLIDKEKVNSPKKIDAVGVAIEVAEALGAIGTRFLQIAGMYIEVPPKYVKVFERVYSDVHGQIKLTAYDTLKTSGKFDEELSEIEIEERCGGGSMFSTYKFVSKRVRQGIMKVLNPNIVGRMKIALDILTKTFEKLYKEDPDKYGGYREALKDIEYWVLADMELKKNAELEPEFRALVSGLKSVEGNYEIAAPATLEVDDRYVVEEFVEGKTLQYLEGQNLENKGEIVGLLRASLFTQILHGLVHSDVHPGNVIVGENGKVYWIDKTLILKLSELERALILDFIIEPSVNKLLDMLLKVEDNLEITEKARLELNKCAGEIEQKADGLNSKLKKGLIQFRQLGLKVPFNLMMVFKNFLGLEKIAA